MHFFRRKLTAQALTAGGTHRVLSALRCGGYLRLFLEPREKGTAVPLQGHPALADMSVLGNAAVARLWPGAETAFVLAETPIEVELFSGLRAALSIWNGERPESIRDWLTWHGAHHGLQAALILDRAPPDEAAEAADRLEAVLNDAAALMGMTVVVLSVNVPLGDPKLGHEAHPMNSPDAPGKDRMTPPMPDPWRAPILFGSYCEMARHQFLSKARGVLALDPVDILPAPKAGQPTVFEAAEAALDGLVPLAGQRAYPWTLRPETPAEIGDHLCVRFDAGPDIHRWCLAPAASSKATVWRWRRIAGLTPAQQPLLFFRCMALRYAQLPGEPQPVSRHAPKSSLIESAALLDIAKQLGAAPRRMPKSGPLPQKSAANDVTIVTTMKNEGPFILEWIAYHRLIGVENFIVYTNDCTDGTDTFLQLLARKGIVEHRENPYREMGLKPQHAALAAAGKEPIVAKASWAICMDLDEYINVKVGDGTLKALFQAVPEANLISMTWRLFGNADVHGFDPAPIIGQFDRCAPEMSRKPHQAWGFKTLYRNISLFRKLGVHRPKGLVSSLSDRINWVNGSGKPMPEAAYRTAWRSTMATIGYDLVQLNHYAVRSAESFLVKRDRGRVNHVDRDQGLAYWFRMNNNFETDRGIMRMLPGLQAEMSRLLEDPEIRAAHEGCIAAHRDHIDRLMQTEQYSRFYADITGERMQRLSRMHRHFGTNVFLAGPGVVPDEMVFQDHPASFFFTVPDVAVAEHQV